MRISQKHRDKHPTMTLYWFKLIYPDLTIIHTNDTHAALENMPRTVTALKDVRGTNPGALLLHAGDAFTGTLFFQ